MTPPNSHAPTQQAGISQSDQSRSRAASHSHFTPNRMTARSGKCRVSLSGKNGIGMSSVSLSHVRREHGAEQGTKQPKYPSELGGASREGGQSVVNSDASPHRRRVPERKCEVCGRRKPRRNMRLILVSRYVLKTRGANQDYETEKELRVCDECILEMNFAPLRENPEVMRCHVCGCTDDRACPGGCYWVEPGLCSHCENSNLADKPDPSRDGKTSGVR